MRLCNRKLNLSRHIRAKHSLRDSNRNKCRKFGKDYLNRLTLSTQLKFCGHTKDFKRSLMRLSSDHCNYNNHKGTLFHHIQEKH